MKVQTHVSVNPPHITNTDMATCVWKAGTSPVKSGNAVQKAEERVREGEPAARNVIKAVCVSATRGPPEVPQGAEEEILLYLLEIPF